MSGREGTGIAGKLPHGALAHIFYFLPLRDLGSCISVCRHWYSYLSVEDNDIWRILCDELVPASALTDSYLLSALTTYKSKVRSIRHAWNPADCSRNMYVKLNGFSVHRNPIAQSTDGARSKLGFKTGRHAWEVWWEGPLGTVAMIGVATKHAALQCQGYVPLLGSDDQGWGWNLVDNTLLHNGKATQDFPKMNNPPKYQVGDRIRVILDCDSHLLYFERGYEFLGVAFVDLPPVKLFACISAVYGNTAVSMVYLGPPVDG